MRLIGFVVLALSLALEPLTAAAEQAEKAYRIGVLSSQAASPISTVLSNALRDRGYVEGRNLIWEMRFAGGRLEQLPDLAADLVRQRIHIIVAAGTRATLVASRATTTIPIVFFGAASPVELGLVQSLARPGGNVTGLSADVTPEVVGKLLQQLRDISPKFVRVALLWSPDTLLGRIYESATREATQTLGIRLQFVDVSSEGDFERALATIADAHPDALWVGADPLVFFHRKRVTDFAAKHLLPTISTLRDVVDDGGLMSYGANINDMRRGLAAYIDKILKGARPADLPVEQPTRFELVINLKTAKRLGLTIPQSVLIRADEIIHQ